MNRTVVHRKVDSDGVLRLNLPLGIGDAEQDVQVIVDRVVARKPMSPEEWRAWVESMAGSWEGQFEPMPWGDFEKRESLS